MPQDTPKKQKAASQVIAKFLSTRYQEVEIKQQHVDVLRLSLPLKEGEVHLLLSSDDAANLVRLEARLALFCPSAYTLTLKATLSEINARLPLGAFYLDSKSLEIAYSYTLVYGDQGFDLSALSSVLDFSLLLFNLEYTHLRQLVEGQFTYEDVLSYLRQMKQFASSLKN